MTTATIPSQLSISDADAARYPMAVGAIAAALDDLGPQRVHARFSLATTPADDRAWLVVDLGPGRAIRLISRVPADDRLLAAEVRRGAPRWARLIVRQKAIKD